jgi:hypothetical protein
MSWNPCTVRKQPLENLDFDTKDLQEGEAGKVQLTALHQLVSRLLACRGLPEGHSIRRPILWQSANYYSFPAARNSCTFDSRTMTPARYSWAICSEEYPR